MTKSEKRMWLTNIENAADAVAAEYGSEVAQRWHSEVSGCQHALIPAIKMTVKEA